MEKALELVRQHERFLVSGHLRADGDCLGAQSVLFHTFRALGKTVRVMNPDPPDGRYGYLHEHTDYEVWQGPDSLPDHDVLFVCDCATLDRLGAMGEQLRGIDSLRVAVDHHVMEAKDEPTWHALVHDIDAPASGLLAVRFAEALGVELPPGAYDAAFTSLATDTGWFKYSNASARAWAAAAEFVAAGVQPHRIFDALYQRWDGGYPRGISLALHSLEYHREGAVAVAWVSRADLAEQGATLTDSDDVLDILRSVETVDAVAFLYDRPDGRVKASLRSKQHTDVNSVARELGGGGHVRASGVTFDDGVTLEAAVARAREALLAGYDRAAAVT